MQALQQSEKPKKLSEGSSKLLQSRSIWEKNKTVLNAWLKQTLEEALEPELEIVDPHHHIWDMRELQGYNLFGMFKQQYYMTDELVDDFICGGHRVTHSVFVTTHAFYDAHADPEWMAPLGEVKFVQGIAAQFASKKYGDFKCAAGIVGSADLHKYGSKIEPLLIACKNICPNYRGIRCSAAHDPKMTKNNICPTTGLYMDPTFRQGFALLQKYDLLFDAFVFASQLDDVYDLAKSFPRTTIVLNHMGSPVAALGDIDYAPSYKGKQLEIIADWKEAMAKIANDCPNVVVKVITHEEHLQFQIHGNTILDFYSIVCS